MTTLNKKDIFQLGSFKYTIILVLLAMGVVTFNYLYNEKNYEPSFLFIISYSFATIVVNLFCGSIFKGLIKEKVSITFTKFNLITQENINSSLHALANTFNSFLAISFIYGIFSYCYEEQSFLESFFFNTLLSSSMTFLLLGSINKNTLTNNKLPDGVVACCLLSSFLSFIIGFFINYLVF